MLQLRDIKSGRVVAISAQTAIEVLDQQGDIALLIMPGLQPGSTLLVTEKDEPVVASNYAKVYGDKVSSLLAPDLDKLIPAMNS